jgi:hypothetical protein
MRSCVVLTAASSVVVACSAVSVRAAVVVVPNANASTLGNGQGMNPFRTYGTGGNRYQQVYSSGQFGNFSSSESITGIAFRAKQPTVGSFIGNSVTVSNVLIRLSTTSASDSVGLDATFANNIGANAATVYSGMLTLTTSAAGTTAIDYSFSLQTPFTYNKSMGNLLLDVTIPDNATVSGNGSIGFSQFDTVTDAFPSADGTSSAFGATGSGTIGSNSTTGVVTRFTSQAIPAPGMAVIFSAAGLFAVRRRRIA